MIVSGESHQNLLEYIQFLFEIRFEFINSDDCDENLMKIYWNISSFYLDKYLNLMKM